MCVAHMVEFLQKISNGDNKISSKVDNRVFDRFEIY